jgi:hypothetical protein
MSGIVLTEVADATIPAPAAGKVTVYMSAEEAGPAFKDDADVVTPLQGATGGVGPTGPAGPAGPGVPPTVTAHGAMGAAETFDYDSGDQTEHSGTLDANCTVTFTNPAASGSRSILVIQLEVDGSGPHTVTLPAAVANKTEAEAVLAAVPANGTIIMPFTTIDGGTTWYAMLDEGGTLDAVIAASSGEDIADALSGAAAPDAGNVFATMADVGGGTPAFVGCKVYKTNQTVTDAMLAFDNELWDTNAFHFTSSANLTGTVAKTATSPNIVGTGTSFTTELSVNQVISIPGTAAEIGVVKTITDNTNLVLWQNMANSASGQTAARVNSAVAIPAGKAGYYSVKASCFVSAAPSRLEIFVNGAIATGRGSGGSTSGNYLLSSADLNLTAGSYVQIKGTAGGSRAYGDAGTAGDYLVFSLSLLGV